MLVFSRGVGHGVGDIRDLVCSPTEMPGRGEYVNTSSAYLKISVGPHLYRGLEERFGIISLLTFNFF